MRHLPIFLDLTGRSVLVLGSGEIGARKAEALERAGADVTIRDFFSSALLDGCALAIGADAPEAELQALSREAMRRGIPVNVVDRSELCSFITPAVIDRDPITIAISSGGASPSLARMLRAKIEAAIPPAFGRLAALAGSFQSELRRRLPDVAARRHALDRILTGRAADLVFAGRDEEAYAAFAAELETTETASTGMVYLVGAGPGASDLLTLRAHRLLGEADVIVHDRLVSRAVLDLARRDAERIYVGKVRANHCVPQEDINTLLVRLARAGKKVVRLKGGDPFIFGRGGEEADELDRAGVAYEVVPGVTAALACAAQAKIPLTYRRISRAVTFVTGHTLDGKIDIDFEAVTRPGGTLAIYMGISALPELCAQLQAHGMAAATPAAVIENGGTPHQRTLRCTVGDAAALAPGWASSGPALLLIGDVIGRTSAAAGFVA